MEASDRAAFNILYQFAFESGRMGERDAEWEIPMSALSFSPNRKRSDCVRDSLRRLMRVVVEVPYTSAEGEPRVLETHLFDFFDLSANEAAPRATVRFGLPKELQPILVQSSRWGRIKAEVCCSMTSKYAIALYELVQLRANLDRCVETFPIARFRDLLGVPPGAYDRGNDFAKRVTDPAVLEVNGLSDMNIEVDLRRRSGRAPIDAVTVTWGRKQGDEFRAAMRERNRSKLGRMARLRGKVEKVTALGVDAIHPAGTC